MTSVTILSLMTECSFLSTASFSALLLATFPLLESGFLLCSLCFPFDFACAFAFATLEPEGWWCLLRGFFRDDFAFAFAFAFALDLAAVLLRHGVGAFFISGVGVSPTWSGVSAGSTTGWGEFSFPTGPGPGVLGAGVSSLEAGVSSPRECSAKPSTSLPRESKAAVGSGVSSLEVRVSLPGVSSTATGWGV